MPTHPSISHFSRSSRVEELSASFLSNLHSLPLPNSIMRSTFYSTTALVLLLLSSAAPSFGLIPSKQKTCRALGGGLQVASSVTTTSDIKSKVAPPNEKCSSWGGVTSADKKKKTIDRKSSSHRRWGVDKNCPSEYWFDTRIHTLGNQGFMGAFHAASAALCTKVIDIFAYDGIDVRREVSAELFQMVGNGKKGKARVIDLCCGVGTSTRALREAFPDAVTVVGVDTSEQMIAMAHFLTDHLSFFKPILVEHLKFLKPFVKKVDIKLSTGYTVLNEQRSKFNKAVRGSFTRGAVTYTRSNAEDTKLPDKSFDLVTVFYAFHEAPQAGRAKILAEARRLLDSGGTLAVIDISPEFKPSKSMLSGEPYAIEYQQNIQRQLLTFNGFIRPEYKVLVPGQVVMWTMRRARNAFI